MIDGTTSKIISPRKCLQIIITNSQAVGINFLYVMKPSTHISPLLIASPDSFLIAESRIPHRIGIIGIKSSQMESRSLYKNV